MKVFNQLKKLINQIRGFFPSRVPAGLTEYNAWIKSITDTYECPGNERSIRFVLSSLLMRLAPAEAYKSKWYFACSLKRTAAAQVAVYEQERIKEEQRAEQLAAQQAEATATEEAAANEQSIQN